MDATEDSERWVSPWACGGCVPLGVWWVCPLLLYWSCDMYSADELTATESEEEEGGTKERLLLRVKTEKLFGKEQDLLEKILKVWLINSY